MRFIGRRRARDHNKRQNSEIGSTKAAGLQRKRVRCDRISMFGIVHWIAMDKNKKGDSPLLSVMIRIYI